MTVLDKAASVKHEQTDDSRLEAGSGSGSLLRKISLLALLAIALVHNFAAGKVHIDYANLAVLIMSVAVIASRPFLSGPAHVKAGCLVIAVALVHMAAPRVFNLDWPTIVLLAGATLLLLLPQMSALAPYVDKLKYKDLEISLRETKKLNQTVKLAEEATPVRLELPKAAAPADLLRRTDTDLEATIIDLAAVDKVSALVRLAIEIEKQITILFSTSGLGNQNPARNWREMLTVLQEKGVISLEIHNALREFWVVRNQVVHAGLAQTRVTEGLLASTLDSGIRLLKLLMEIPRPTYRIHRTGVPLYTDPACAHKVEDTVGVIVESIDPSGVISGRAIHPAGRNFVRRRACWMGLGNARSFWQNVLPRPGH